MLQRDRNCNHYEDCVTGFDGCAGVLNCPDGEPRELARLAERLKRAENLLEQICHVEGSLEEGEPCTVCGFKEHQEWCWYPALIEWDRWQAGQ